MPRTCAMIRRARRSDDGGRPVIDRAPDPVRHPVRPENVSLLWGADNATRARVALQLQRQAGNRFVQGLVQRQAGAPIVQGLLQRDDPVKPAAPLTDAQQWEKDWTDYSQHQSYFNAKGRPDGTPRERYDVLCPLYKANGIPRPMVYLDTSITTAKFFDFRTPAHTRLATALATAEATLKGKGFTSANFKSVWALNPRTQSNGRWSDHATGQAVDIDPDTNPHLTDAKERKVISLVTGTDMDQQGVSYDAMKAASDRFKADYNAAGLERRGIELKAEEKNREAERDTVKSQRDTLKGQRDTITAEIKALKKQLQAVPKGKKATAVDRQKATELSESIKTANANLTVVQTELKQKEAELKKKEVTLAQAKKNRELIEKQLERFKATEATFQAVLKSISDLEASVATLPGDIAAINDQIAKSRQDEKAAHDAKDKKGVQAQRTLRAGLSKTLAAKQAALKKEKAQLKKKKDERDSDHLRQYAAGGFLNLPKEVVEAMTAAGLTWGGSAFTAKDFMHFQL